MKKWIKRLFVTVIVLLIGVAAFLGTSYWMSKRKPAWYKPMSADSKEMTAAANRAMNKFLRLQNMGGRAASAESSRPWRESQGAATLPAPGPETLTFTQDELTGFVARWSQYHDDQIEKYLTGPQFLIEDGYLKFACHITEIDQIGVITLLPNIDADGMLRLEIVSISAGTLPLPEGMLRKRLQPMQDSLIQWLPGWQKRAKLGSDGANTDAVKVAMTKLLLHTLHHEPASPILYMWIDSHKTVPVKLTQIGVAPGALTLTFSPLNDADRQAAAKHLAEPYGPPLP